MTIGKTALVAAFCAFVFPAFGDDQPTNPPPAMETVTPADFAWDAAVINLKEIRLGEAAQTNSQNEAVQDFGKHMVRDHSRLEARLAKIAMAEGLPLPDTNTFDVFVPPQENEKPATELMAGTPAERLRAAQLDVQDLSSMSGTAFDQAYADAMVKGHEKAVEKFEAASASLQDEPLKRYANTGLRAIRHHLEMAEQLQSGLMQNTNAPAGGMTNMPNM